MDDPFDLGRFVKAQDGVFARALEELRAGRKRSHWMWFVFPQLRGLGRSSTASRYGLTGIEEAKAYLEHPILGARLAECVDALNRLEGRTAEQIFGFPAWMKLRSCLTLFALADPKKASFTAALEKYFEGAMDPATLELLGL